MGFHRLLGTRHTLNGFGDIDADTIPAICGGSSLSGTCRRNFCNKLVRNRNTSILVSTSPRHIRRPTKQKSVSFKKKFTNYLPTEKGIKYSGFETFPSFRKRSGMKFSGFSQRSGSIFKAYRLGRIWVVAGILYPAKLESLREFEMRITEL